MVGFVTNLPVCRSAKPFSFRFDRGNGSVDTVLRPAVNLMIGPVMHTEAPYQYRCIGMPIYQWSVYVVEKIPIVCNELVQKVAARYLANT